MLLRYTNKIVSYFSSSFVNSTRYSHSVTGLLKLFFERNNKDKSTVTNLGNLFRNSKWSDLKVQNLKEIAIKDWTFLFIFILLIIPLTLLTLSSILGFGGKNNLIFISSTGDFYLEIFFTLLSHTDYITALVSSYSYYALFLVDYKTLFNSRTSEFTSVNKFLQTRKLSTATNTLYHYEFFSKNKSDKNIELFRSILLLKNQLSFFELNNSKLDLVPYKGALIANKLPMSFPYKLYLVSIKDSVTAPIDNNFNLSLNNYSCDLSELNSNLSSKVSHLKLLNLYNLSKYNFTKFLNLNIYNLVSLAKQEK